MKEILLPHALAPECRESARKAPPRLSLNRARQYWETVRHLTVGQIVHQARHRLSPARIRTATAERAEVNRLELVEFAGRDRCDEGGGRFRFLHHQVNLGQPVDWEAAAQPYLWRYHLHYFDWLGQAGLEPEAGWASMRDWIARHQPRTESVGWEPYPLSLRVVNWLKFLHREDEYPDDILRSLMLQGANLERRIEHHLAGNHVFANGKGLWWLGQMLGQPDWQQRGRRIVLRELARQFRPDGGHFELSPMYHSILLEDILDLANLSRGAGDEDALRALRHHASRALGWLEGMMNSEGQVPLLNDSAGGMARDPHALRCYAARLGITAASCPTAKRDVGAWTGSNWSGYWVFRGAGDRMQLLFDTAPLGPDHLPGHAHCDLLAVLLEADGRPILTDTGVLEYAEGPARALARSTGAHNTVKLDGLEQAEMWKSFRMGRRGHPGPVQFDGHEVRCTHDGFARLRPGLRHERVIKLRPDGFLLADELAGPAEHRFESRFHFAPGLEVEAESPGQWRVDRRLRFRVHGAAARLETSLYFPEFGRSIERPCLVLSGSFQRQTRVELLCTFCS